MSTLLRNARLADGRRADVTIDGGLITSVIDLSAGEPANDGRPADDPPRRLAIDDQRGGPAAGDIAVHDLTGFVLLPSAVEPHAHLDKALTADLAPNPRGDLLGAIDAWVAFSAGLTPGEVALRAEKAALELVASGITAVRTHVNVRTGHLSNIEALVTVRDRLRGVLDIQIASLTSIAICGGADAYRRTLLEATTVDQCVLVGGCPHLDDDAELATDISLEVAGETGRAIDLHTDENIDPKALYLPYFAERVRKLGFKGGATASHCVSLGVLEPSQQRDIAESVADAGVAVVALPQTNLFLQGRDHPRSTPRGLTALRALLTAGATLAAGADNVRDPFNTMGRSDPMETAALLVMAGHLLPGEAYAAVTDGARAAMGVRSVTVEVGAPADLVAIRGGSLSDAMARADPERTVWKSGRITARTTVERHLAPRMNPPGEPN